jgi:hypothetical protein
MKNNRMNKVTQQGSGQKKHNDHTRVKTIKMAAWLVLLLVTGTKIFAQGDAKEPKDQKEQLVVPLSSPGKSYTLRVNLISGSIKVVTYPGKEIVIDVSNRDRREDDEMREGGSNMKRISGGSSYEITAHEDNNAVSVSGGKPERGVDLSLKIPQEIKQLRLGTVNGGNIDVDNIKGELEISNVNGAIKLTNIAGSVVANTVNGNIVVNFISVDPKAPMAFTTLNGNVDVSFPGDTKANFKMRSERGQVYSDFDMAIDKSEAKVQKSEQSGVYKLKLEDWVNGKTNGGGAEILMKTMQGNVYVRKAK